MSEKAHGEDVARDCDEDAVRGLEEALDYRFTDHTLALTSLAHPSYAHEVDGSRGNERLEFLGDAVLDLVVAEILFAQHPDWAEGDLTRARAGLVNKSSLAARARDLDLGSRIRLGRTEQRTRGGEKDSVLANCFEAVIGAVYLDGGLAAVTPVVHQFFEEALARGGAKRDAKTAFQEWVHAEFRVTPSYRLVNDSQIEDDDERFTVEVRVSGEAWGVGVGRTKRAAERRAAAAAIERKASTA